MKLLRTILAFSAILPAALFGAGQAVTVQNNGTGVGTFNTAGVTSYVIGQPVTFTGGTTFNPLPIQASVTTIALLRSYTVTPSIPNGAAVQVTGYYAANDGGGGVYVWNNTSVATDNGGTIIKPNGVTTGRWLLQYSGPLNALWFGAYANNTNAATTTAAIQSALTAAGVNGTVYLPAGTYAVNSSLTFYGSVIGAYWTNTTPNLATATTGTVINYTGSGTSAPFVAGTSVFGVRVANLFINIANTSGATVGIDYPSAGSLNIVENIVMSSSSTVNQGIYLRGQNPSSGLGNSQLFRNVFRNIYVSGMKVGIRLGDDIALGVANGNLIEGLNEGCTTYAAEITGYGNTILHPDFSTVGVRYFGSGTGNSIIGGYIDALVTTQVTLDSTSGQRDVFDMVGSLNGSPDKIVDNVAPTNTERYTILGYSNTISRLFNKDGTYLMGFDTVNKRVVVGGSSSNGGTTTFPVLGSIGVLSRNVSSTYSAVASDATLLADATSASFTITLLNPSTNGPRLMFVRRVDSTASHAVTLSVAGGGTINGASSYVLTFPNDGVLLADDGTNYSVVARVANGIPNNTPFYGRNAAGNTNYPLLTLTAQNMAKLGSTYDANVGAGATYNITATGNFIGMVMIADDLNNSAIIQLQGSTHATAIVSDPTSSFSITKGTASRTNVYWDAGSSQYQLENQLGGTRQYILVGFGFGG